MMADAVLYTSMDEGAPNLNASFEGIAGRATIKQLYQLLVSCLVEGYGDKPGQGWELVHKDLPKGFTLKNPDGTYVAVSHHASTDYYTSTLWFAESITEPYQYPPNGVNVRSGHHSESYNSNTSNYYKIGANNGDNARFWALVARGSSFYLTIRTGNNADWFNSYSSYSMSSYGSASGVLFLGSFLPRIPTIPSTGIQNYFAIGQGVFDSITSSDSSLHNLSNVRMRLRNPITGEIEKNNISNFSCNLWDGTDDSNRNSTGIDTYPRELVLLPQEYFEPGYGYIGVMPGIFKSPRYQTTKISELFKRLGKNPSKEDILIPYDINGISVYFIPTSYGVLPITLEEKYWTI